MAEPVLQISNLVAAPYKVGAYRVRSRAAFQNSQAEMSHVAGKNPMRNTIGLGQFAPVEPSPPITAMMPTST